MSGRSPSTAASLDEVRWDYQPEDDWISPLVSVDRYFSAFPWDGEEPETADEGPAG